MRSVALAVRDREVTWLAGSGALSLLVGVVLVRDPSLVRPVVAGALGLALVVLAMVHVRAAIIVTFALLPVLALARRLLIETTAWTSMDPLVLLAPTLVLLLVLRMYLLESRPLAGDALSALVLCFLGITILESINPRGGGLVAGAAGLLYVGGPLLWFFVGRDLIDHATLRVLLMLLPLMGAATASYGLAQTERGFTSWDTAWIQQAGYTGLNVGQGVIRAFGTFSSSQEYATYLGIAGVTAICFALRRNLLWLAPTPLLLTAMFLASARAVLVSTALALVVVFGLRAGTRRRAAVVVALGLLLIVAFVRVYRPLIEAKAAATGNPLVVHQVLGVTSPLDRQQSTFLLHFDEFLNGIKSGIRDPVGQGTAVVSLGGSRFGAAARATESDVSNAFVGCGLLGGLIFLALVVLALARAASVALRERDATSLAVAALLLVTFGQWLNGGMYAVTPLVWLALGWTARRWRSHREEQPA